MPNQICHPLDAKHGTGPPSWEPAVKKACAVMPELPEVETVRRALAPVMEGARFSNVQLNRPDLRFPLPAGFRHAVSGKCVERLDRRGKYLLAFLSNRIVLVMHLGMSGRFRIEHADGGAKGAAQLYHGRADDPRHDHVCFMLDRDHDLVRIVYNDPRRFGFMDLVAMEDLEQCRHFATMGPEPLSPGFTAQTLGQALKGKATPIKAALLDQRVVAGLGNIYVCEALYRSGISPRRKAGRIAAERIKRLHREIRAVLLEAIGAGGSTLRDFASANGKLGYFQHTFQVYDRCNANCNRCDGPIRRIVQGGRSTFYCPRCQH